MNTLNHQGNYTEQVTWTFYQLRTSNILKTMYSVNAKPLIHTINKFYKSEQCDYHNSRISTDKHINIIIAQWVSAINTCILYVCKMLPIQK